jgi:hypothetical protein
VGEDCEREQYLQDPERDVHDLLHSHRLIEPGEHNSTFRRDNGIWLRR